LSKASKARNPSCCLGGEREYGEAWVTEFLRSFFRWIFPHDVGEVGRDSVKKDHLERVESLKKARSFEVELDIRGMGEE
jgi:hypothetical protein